MIAVLSIMLILTIARKSASNVEVSDSVYQVLEATVENVLDEKKEDYTIENKEEFIADFTESLLVTIDTASDIEVTVYSYDPVSGVLSVKVKETYKEPDGSLGTAECTATAIVDFEVEEPLPEQVTVNMYYTDINNKYKLYKTMTVRSETKIQNPGKPFGAKGDGNWVYVSDNSAVNWGDVSDPGLEISTTMDKIENNQNQWTVNICYK